MQQLLLIAAGGAAGSVLRYLIVLLTHAVVGGAFPLGTLVVNTLGCFALGFVAGALQVSWGWRDVHRVAVTVGLLGGFTTFSAYAYDTFALAQEGRRGLALLNVAAENSCGVTAAWLGWWVASRFLARVA